MADLNMSEGPQGSTGLVGNLTTDDINDLTSLVNAIKNSTLETQSFLKEMMEGQKLSLKTAKDQRQASIELTQKDKVIRQNATFERWNGEPLTWTPHYYLLKSQCRVYKPLLVTDEAICMKIYESIPEPQRQGIREYDWKEMLEVYHSEYFDQVGAQKVERKLLAMRQGESQLFRKLLQEWELQLECAGGRDWLDSIKTNKLRSALSEKIQNKYAALDLSINDYQRRLRVITWVAAIIEDSEKFIPKGEKQTTQFATRSGALQTSLVAKLNISDNNRKNEAPKSKPPAPLKNGHFARYCKKFGPPERPVQNQRSQTREKSNLRKNRAWRDGESGIKVGISDHEYKNFLVKLHGKPVIVNAVINSTLIPVLLFQSERGSGLENGFDSITVISEEFLVDSEDKRDNFDHDNWVQQLGPRSEILINSSIVDNLNQQESMGNFRFLEVYFEKQKLVFQILKKFKGFFHGLYETRFSKIPNTWARDIIKLFGK
ncbi:hypothetical protein EPUL_000567 [Erysiphe pulchra]|uniref:Uncharacterized protein n=1 Tax=Erysiphe pulchra TaxID=225359 RepID=A0A2S4PWJ9_9PEZI|nr:hypothetical protein EPUL_000567 [Erysiphe pulchra]